MRLRALWARAEHCQVPSSARLPPDIRQLDRHGHAGAHTAAVRGQSGARPSDRPGEHHPGGAGAGDGGAGHAALDPAFGPAADPHYRVVGTGCGPSRHGCGCSRAGHFATLRRAAGCPAADGRGDGIVGLVAHAIHAAGDAAASARAHHVALRWNEPDRHVHRSGTRRSRCQHAGVRGAIPDRRRVHGSRAWYPRCCSGMLPTAAERARSRR